MLKVQISNQHTIIYYYIIIRSLIIPAMLGYPEIWSFNVKQIEIEIEQLFTLCLAGLFYVKEKGISEDLNTQIYSRTFSETSHVVKLLP